MTTLRIEHEISDFTTWREAFGRAEAIREKAGVRSYVISRPVDDEKYVMVDLTFDDEAGAQELLTMLRTFVWTNPEHSPALVGQPQAKVCEVVEST